MPIKLAVGIPAYRGVVASSQALMWMQFGAELNRTKPVIQMVMHASVDVCGVDRARNILLAQAMSHGADWLLMIDSDTWVDPGSDLVRMIIEAPEHIAMIGAAVRTRGLGRGNDAPLNLYEWKASEGRHLPVDLIPDHRHNEVDAIGGAVIAINLHRVPKDLVFKWHYYDDGRSISEDLYFCRELRRAGEYIFIDTRVKTFHVDKPATLSNG
jgi:hypothetical protein